MKKIALVFSLMLVCSIGMSQSPTHCDCEDVAGLSEWYGDISASANCETMPLDWVLLEQWQDEDGGILSNWDVSGPWNGQTYAVVVMCHTWWSGPWPHAECRVVM